MYVYPQHAQMANIIIQIIVRGFLKCVDKNVVNYNVYCMKSTNTLYMCIFYRYVVQNFVKIVTF